MKRAAALAIFAGIGTTAIDLVIRDVHETRRADKNASLVWQRDAELARKRRRDSLNNAEVGARRLRSLECQTLPRFNINQPGEIIGYETKCR